MYPHSFSISVFSINAFGVMLALAFLCAYLAASRELERKGAPPGLAGDMLLWIAACSLAGAKAFFIAENFTPNQIAADPLGVIFARSGLTFYGGFIGGLAAGIYRAHKSGFGVAKALDACAPALALAYAVGRIGCLLIGDDYGTASSLPWAIAFPEGSPPVDYPVHPTQLYETLIMGGVFLALRGMAQTPRADGRLFAFYLVFAGTERFLIEFLRTTTPSPVPGLSVAQVIALGLISFGAVKLIKDRK